jgi:hypothetical protein
MHQTLLNILVVITLPKEMRTVVLSYIISSFWNNSSKYV